jgi:ParB family chromosome partitioning protein
VPVDRLEPNPVQPRSLIDPARLAELAASIQESGMVQPILVRRAGGGYQIIAGERRWRAAQQIGLATVPVTVREVPDDRLLELALVENIQREELSPLEEAAAFQRLQEELRLTQEEVARKVGRDRSTVANTVRLLRLPREVRDLISAGSLDGGHGRALLALEGRCARWSGGWPCCARRAPRARSARSPTPGPRRSGCAPPSAPGWRSVAAARAGRSASASTARRS